MARIFYIHWNMSEALAHVHEMRSWGYQVNFEVQDGARACRAVVENGADVIIISLARLPSHGRVTAEHLRKLRATRETPILFTDGDPEKIVAIRNAVPDAIFISRPRLQHALLGLATAGPEESPPALARPAAGGAALAARPALRG